MPTPPKADVIRLILFIIASVPGDGRSAVRIALASAMNAWHNDPVRRYMGNRHEMNRYLRATDKRQEGDTTYVDMTQLA